MLIFSPSINELWKDYGIDYSAIKGEKVDIFQEGKKSEKMDSAEIAIVHIGFPYGTKT